MIKQYKLRFYNFRLVLFLLLISGIGVELVGTARQDLQTKQLAGVILGVFVMLILSLIDYSWILNFQWIMYGFNIVMLLGVRLFGDSANGAARWIDLGFIRFQPTELTKIIIILFFAKFFMDHEDDLNTLKTLVQAAVLLIIPLALVYSQPDMKNTITIAVMFCILIYIAGLKYKIIGGSILIAIPLLIIFLSIVVQPDQKLIKDYQRDRIMTFLYPENEEYSDDVEQQNNSKTAIASGELIGKRLSKEENTASVNEGNFVAENQTDFIFAVAGEEYPNEPKGKGSGRQTHMLRSGNDYCTAGVFEYFCCNGNRPEYRNASSFCKLWTHFPCQYVYRNGVCFKCRPSGQSL